MWKIRAHLPTVSLADEWQRQEKLLRSQQECICRSGKAKKLRNEDGHEEWRLQVLEWDRSAWGGAAGIHYYHPEVC